jgi:hypothetical protein
MGTEFSVFLAQWVLAYYEYLFINELVFNERANQTKGTNLLFETQRAKAPIYGRYAVAGGHRR